MINRTYQIQLITPLFSRGVVEDQPEIRAPSIRGMLHWWFRALGGKFEDEREVFGGIGKPCISSRLVVRVKHDDFVPVNLPLLPHKSGSQASPKPSVPIGTVFDVMIGLRRPFDQSQESRIEATIEKSVLSWLLMGSLGMRSTRGGGSILCSSVQPDSLSGYRQQVESIISGAPVIVYCCAPVFEDADAARVVITDTIGGPSDSAHKGNDLRSINYPLGVVRDKGSNKSAPNRKTSPLRLTVRKFKDGYRIVAVWDERNAVTENSFQNLASVIGMLESAGKRLGSLLPQNRDQWICGMNRPASSPRY